MAGRKELLERQKEEEKQESNRDLPVDERPYDYYHYGEIDEPVIIGKRKTGKMVPKNIIRVDSNWDENFPHLTSEVKKRVLEGVISALVDKLKPDMRIIHLARIIKSENGYQVLFVNDTPNDRYMESAVCERWNLKSGNQRRLVSQLDLDKPHKVPDSEFLCYRYKPVVKPDEKTTTPRRAYNPIIIELRDADINTVRQNPPKLMEEKGGLHGGADDFGPRFHDKRMILGFLEDQIPHLTRHMIRNISKSMFSVDFNDLNNALDKLEQTHQDISAIRDALTKEEESLSRDVNTRVYSQDSNRHLRQQMDHHRNLAIAKLSKSIPHIRQKQNDLRKLIDDSINKVNQRVLNQDLLKNILFNPLKLALMEKGMVKGSTIFDILKRDICKKEDAGSIKDVDALYAYVNKHYDYQMLLDKINHFLTRYPAFEQTKLFAMELKNQLVDYMRGQDGIFTFDAKSGALEYHPETPKQLLKDDCQASLNKEMKELLRDVDAVNLDQHEFMEFTGAVLMLSSEFKKAATELNTLAELRAPLEAYVASLGRVSERYKDMGDYQTAYRHAALAFSPELVNDAMGAAIDDNARKAHNAYAIIGTTMAKINKLITELSDPGISLPTARSMIEQRYKGYIAIIDSQVAIINTAHKEVYDLADPFISKYVEMNQLYQDIFTKFKALLTENPQYWEKRRKAGGVEVNLEDVTFKATHRIAAMANQFKEIKNEASPVVKVNQLLEAYLAARDRNKSKAAKMVADTTTFRKLFKTKESSEFYRIIEKLINLPPGDIKELQEISGSLTEFSKKEKANGLKPLKQTEYESDREEAKSPSPRSPGSGKSST